MNLRKGIVLSYIDEQELRRIHFYGHSKAEVGSTGTCRIVWGGLLKRLAVADACRQRDGPYCKRSSNECCCLLRSPIASFRWARAKHKALAKLTQNGVSGWQGRRSNSFAECEQDGIVMGF